MHVVETSDPVEVGKSMAYRVTVTNRGQTADRNVVLVATVPPQMIPNPLNVGGPPQFDIQGQTVKFKPVATFLPGEERTYEIGVVAKTPGSGRFTARLSSATLQQAKVLEESTRGHSQAVKEPWPCPASSSWSTTAPAGGTGT